MLENPRLREKPEVQGTNEGGKEPLDDVARNVINVLAEVGRCCYHTQKKMCMTVIECDRECWKVVLPMRQSTVFYKSEQLFVQNQDAAINTDAVA